MGKVDIFPPLWAFGSIFVSISDQGTFKRIREKERGKKLAFFHSMSWTGRNSPPMGESKKKITLTFLLIGCKLTNQPIKIPILVVKDIWERSIAMLSPVMHKVYLYLLKSTLHHAYLFYDWMNYNLKRQRYFILKMLLKGIHAKMGLSIKAHALIFGENAGKMKKNDTCCCHEVTCSCCLHWETEVNWAGTSGPMALLVDNDQVNQCLLSP